MEQVLFWEGVDWEVLESHFEMVTTKLNCVCQKGVSLTKISGKNILGIMKNKWKGPKAETRKGRAVQLEDVNERYSEMW